MKNNNPKSDPAPGGGGNGNEGRTNLKMMPEEMKKNFELYSITILQLQHSLLAFNPAEITDEKVYEILRFHLEQIVLDKKHEMRKTWLKKPVYVEMVSP